MEIGGCIVWSHGASRQQLGSDDCLTVLIYVDRHTNICKHVSLIYISRTNESKP